jgi:WD40 repeat protein
VDAGDGAPITTIGGEGEDVAGCSAFRSRVDLSPDGRVLAANSHDYTVELADVTTGERTKLDGPSATVLDVTFSPDGDQIVASSEDSAMRIWRRDGLDAELTATLDAVPGGYYALAWSPDGSTIAASDIAGAVTLLDASSGQPILLFTGTKHRDTDLQFTPDGRYLVSGDVTGEVVIWSVETGQEALRLPGHAGTVTDIAVRADGRAVASGSVDGTVRVRPLDGLA